MNRYKGHFILGTFLGAAVAGVATLLLTPKSGEDVRKAVATQASDAKESAMNYINIAKDKGKEMKDTMTETATDLQNLAQNTGQDIQDDMDRAVEAYQEAEEEVTDIITDSAEDLEETSQEAMDQVDKA